MSEYVIDRKTAQDLFEELLDAKKSCRVLWLHGRGKMGKSHLLKVFHRRAYREVFCAYVQVAHTKYTNNSSVLQALVHQLGTAHFSTYHKVVSKQAEHHVKVDFNDVSASDHAKIFVSASKGDTHTDIMRQNELTTAFLTDVQQLVRRKKRALFLFDALDQADAGVRQWVQDYLLMGLHHIEHTLVVVAGRETPTVTPPWEFNCVAHELGAVSLQDYLDFCAEKATPLPEGTVKAFYAVFKGSPGQFCEAFPSLQQAYQRGEL